MINTALPRTVFRDTPAEMCRWRILVVTIVNIKEFISNILSSDVTFLTQCRLMAMDNSYGYNIFIPFVCQRLNNFDKYY